jgi:beta-lactamase regulating signal transducer with metallopeptidase domain
MEGLFAQSGWAERIGWVLVHSLWQFTLVAIWAGVLQRALRRRSATARYGALLAALSILVAMPVATWFSPWSARPSASAVEMPAGVVPSQQSPRSSHRVDPGAKLGISTELPREESPGELMLGLQPDSRNSMTPTRDLASSLSLVEGRIRPWLPEIVLVWLAGVVLAAFRPLWSWHTVRRLRTRGISPVSEAMQGVLKRTATRLRVARAVEVLQSALVTAPVVVGYFRPVVLLPLCVVTGLPERQLELILAHELAHIRRHDYLVNVLQTLAETLFFYHPALWWLSRQIRIERENCCDDVAMGTVGSREEYGRALLAIEELRAAPTALSLGARGGSLLARIRRIAGSEPAPSAVGAGSVLGVVLLSAALLGAATFAAAPAEQEPAAPQTATKPEDQPGQTVDPDDVGFHLVRGRTTWIGTKGAPLVYDGYDSQLSLSWDPHAVVLSGHTEGVRYFYCERTLLPRTRRTDIGAVPPASEPLANIVVPGVIDLPAYSLLLQPSIQQVLKLSEQQRNRLQEISAKYWAERRQIAGKELDDIEVAAQERLAEFIAKAHVDAACVEAGSIEAYSPEGNSPFSREVVERLERQWSESRRPIEAVLTPDQLRTLKELTFRTFAFGSGILFEPQVLERLGVAKNEQDRLRALEPELQKEKDRRLRGVRREKIQKMLAVLTPQQQAHLRKELLTDENPEMDCTGYPYPSLSRMPDSEVAEELGLSAEQRERVRTITRTHWESRIALDDEVQRLSPGDEKAFQALREKRLQEMANLRKQIAGALTPEQWARCQEIALENQVMFMLGRIVRSPDGPIESIRLSEIAAEDRQLRQALNGTGLSGEQIAAMRKIEAEYADRPQQIYCELTDKALAAFTPEQQEKLRAEVDRRGW